MSSGSMWARRVIGTMGAAVVLGACGGGPSPGPPGTSSTTPSTSVTTIATSAPTTAGPSSSTSTTAAPTTSRPSVYMSTPIYFVGESRGSFVLYREFRTVRAIDGRVSSAISAMTRLQPLDPDYLNPWRPASWVWVTQRGSTLTVDLSADAFANTNVGSELASRAVQQLVHTATAAAHVAGYDATSVVITVDGKAADAWGVVRLGEPIARAPMIEVQAHAWVVEPQEGATVPAGTVNFTGYGTSFEATFMWQVTNLSGAVVAKGSAMGGSMGTFGTVRFSAKLTPGTYVVQLATDDPSGGAGEGPAVDTKRFTVR